jgi:hypothetical protein
MSLLKKLQAVGQKTDAVLMHPTAPAYPNADRLEITYPGADAEWTPAESIDVSWDLKGEVGTPLSIALIQATGQSLGEQAYCTPAGGRPEGGAGEGRGPGRPARRPLCDQRLERRSADRPQRTCHHHRPRMTRRKVRRA